MQGVEGWDEVTKIIKQKTGPMVVIADDAGLIYSDDWRRGWVKGFKDIGCTVKVIDISPLRRQSFGGPFSVRGMPAAVAMASNIIAMKPDLVFCHHGRAAGNDHFLQRLRRVGAKTAVYLCDEPYEVGETARYSPKFDYVFSMDYCTVETHRNARHKSTRNNVFYLPPCADDAFFKYRDYREREIPAFFLGNPTLRPRKEWLEAVEKGVPGAQIKYWPSKGRPIAKGHPSWINAEDHPKYYANTLVGLNIHRHPGITTECYRSRVRARPSTLQIPQGMVLAPNPPKIDGTGFWNDADLPASHVNPRFFEFAACGTLVVSDDHRDEMERMFPFAPRAQSQEHFVELVRYYIEHKKEAEEIGILCSRLVTKLHSYRHRALEVLIRVGLKRLVREEVVSSLEAQGDFLTPQDLQHRTDSLSSERTGRSARWSPPSGSSLMEMYGNPSRADSLDVPPTVLPW